MTFTTAMELQHLRMHSFQLLSWEHLKIKFGIEPELREVRKLLVNEIDILVENQRPAAEMKHTILEQQRGLQLLVDLLMAVVSKISVQKEGRNVNALKM